MSTLFGSSKWAVTTSELRRPIERLSLEMPTLRQLFGTIHALRPARHARTDTGPAFMR